VVTGPSLAAASRPRPESPERAKAVRAYVLSTGKVEASRLYLTENQTGGVRSDGSRVYLQFR
jgi:hypothetical protein